jgi:hypothetical protein
MMSFVYGMLGLVVFAAISPPMQLLARRIMPTVSPVVVLAAAFLVAHITSALLGAELTPSFRYWAAASVFCFGAMVYVQVFGAVFKSISLRILLDLTSRPGGTVTFEEISEREVLVMFAERCDLLVEGGMIFREGGKFVPTSAGKKLAARVAWLRRLFAIGDSGLYNFDFNHLEERAGD